MKLPDLVQTGQSNYFFLESFLEKLKPVVFEVSIAFDSF